MIAFSLAVIGICCLAAMVMAAIRGKEDIEEVAVSQPKPKKKRPPKVRSYSEHQKRMNKRKYLSEHSEYVYISTPEAQDIVGIQDQELIDSILDAILNGDKVVKVKRETYNKIKDGKILQDGY